MANDLHRLEEVYNLVTKARSALSVSRFDPDLAPVVDSTIDNLQTAETGLMEVARLINERS